ncbi:nitroreductase/quinone reductase family protein [Saccharopolyspora sp. 5N708]|uniref:nitroreductase/quinone reductase family protein n=1 Tax=Saccharopolyspora sp. 5N708 TaxID=3457424 RepID=UPI003FCFE38E
MAFDRTSSGTRGARVGAAMFFMRLLRPLLIKVHRRTGNTFQGMDLLYLETVGAKSGEQRKNPVAYFADGDAHNAWLIVASLGGAATNPAWYHNLAAHPDQVVVEINGRRHRVVPEQLHGDRRDEAWQRIIASQPRYAAYQEKTDRVLPVIRLSRVD